MVDYKIGFILFVDEKNGKNGLGYCESSNEPKIKVSSFKELDPNIIWLTNLPSELIKNYPYIKGFDFFGIKIDTIIYQLGLTTSTRYNIAKEMSNILKKTIDKLVFNYNINLNDKTIVNNLINIFDLKKIKYNDDLDVVKILKNNNNNFAVTNIAKTKNELQSYLFVNRYQYNRDLCKISVPSGVWKDIDDSKFKNKDKSWYVSLLKKYHFIVNVKINNIPKELNYLLPNDYKNKKVWLTDFEFLFLSKFTEIYVSELKISSEKIHLNKLEPKKLFKVSSYEKSSISNGIAAYNYVHSFIENNPESILSSWIKIHDRVEMLKKSVYFLKYNIKVLSYGSGSLLISFTQDKDSEKVIKLSSKLNLLYPMVLLTL